MKFEIAHFKDIGQYDTFEYKVIREIHPIELKYSVSLNDPTPKPYITHENEYIIYWLYSRNKNWSKHHPNFKTYANCKSEYERLIERSKSKINHTIEIIKEFPTY